MQREGIPETALRQFNEHFENSPFIGKAQIYGKEETGLGPHKFYYLGFKDLFGVEYPRFGSKKGVEFQIWPAAWVRRRLPNLDKAIRLAMRGEFPEVRHNIQLKKRAKQSGAKFFEGPVYHKKPALAVEEKDRLPIRGRKVKRERRPLKAKRKRRALKV